MSRILRVGVCQLNSVWEDRATTRERILQLLEEDSEPLDCLVFPEMTLTGFSMNSKATTLMAEDHAFFRGLAHERMATVVYGGVEDQCNRMFVVNPTGGGVAYSKQHLFSFGEEGQYYLPGKGGAIATIGGARLGLAICYDLRFTYQFWSTAENVDGYLVIANWPDVRREHWITLLKARAIENLAFVIGVNRVGQDPKLQYSGDSRIFGPTGEEILGCGKEEGLSKGVLNLDQVSEVRAQFGFLKDRK